MPPPMMLAPTAWQLPEFASQATNIAAPPFDLRARGWSVNEAPPSSYFNWLHRLTYDWLNYLSYERVLVEDFVRPNPRVFPLNAINLVHSAPSGTFGPHFAAGPFTWSRNSKAVIKGTGGGWSGYLETPAPHTAEIFSNVITEMILTTSRTLQTSVGPVGPSGSYQAFGIKNTSQFVMTGGASSAQFPAGVWAYQWVPNPGFNPTAVSLGATFMSGRFEWAYSYPSMAVSWWPDGSPTPTSIALRNVVDYDLDTEVLGVWGWAASGVESIELSVDRIDVGIKRNAQGL